MTNCSDNKVSLISSVSEINQQFIELDLLNNKLFEDLYTVGYRVKTVNKMLDIIVNSESITEVKDKFLFIFGNSPTIFDNCKAIIKNYLKSKNHIVA